MRPKLTKISSDQVLEALNNHALWLSDQSQGAQANFTFCDLKGYDFSQGDLTKVIFTGANLSRAKFTSCILDEANLNGTIIKDGIFKDCSLNETNFNYANLQNSKFESIEATNCYFGGANLTQANIADSCFNGCCFDYACFSALSASNTIFTDCSFCTMTADLVLRFTNTAFVSANLTGARYGLGSPATLSMTDCYIQMGEDKYTLIRKTIEKNNLPKEADTKRYFRYLVRISPEDSRIGNSNTLVDCGSNKKQALKWVQEHLKHLGDAAESVYIEEREYVGIENLNRDFSLYSRPIWTAAFHGFDVLEEMQKESD